MIINQNNNNFIEHQLLYKNIHECGQNENKPRGIPLTFSDMSIAELIKEHTDTESFREYLQVQHGNNMCEYYLSLLQNTAHGLRVWDALYQFLEFISGVDTDKVNPYIEKLIATKEPLVKVVTDLFIFHLCITR